MDIEDLRRQSIKDEQRRQSLKTEQQIRHQVITNQPRNSIGSEMSSSEKTTSLASPLAMGGGGFGDLALMTLRAKRVSNRLRRKSVNPKIDPPPGLEGINDKGFVYVRQQMDMDLKGERDDTYIFAFLYHTTSHKQRLGRGYIGIAVCPSFSILCPLHILNVYGWISIKLNTDVHKYETMCPIPNTGQGKRSQGQILEVITLQCWRRDFCLS